MDTNSVTIVPVVLCGGAGTRLWPMSNDQQPKQFLRLVSELTLLQDTLIRTRGLEGRIHAPVILCNEGHLPAVVEQCREIEIEPHAIVLEPAGRNTAPAAAAAALVVGRNGERSAAETLLLVLPADHVILDAGAFVAAVTAAIDAATAGNLVTFGVTPNAPETGFGYIRRGADSGGWSQVEAFVEKPALATAEAYLQSGRYLWNSGMFLFAVPAWLEALTRYAPDVLSACEIAVAGATAEGNVVRLADSFRQCPSVSIDVAVMEKTDRAVVVPLDAGWSDVGSWSALHDLLRKDASGNVLVGDVVTDSCEDSYVAANSRTVVAIGLDGVVVVETADAVLVMSRDKAQNLKGVVDVLKTRRGSGPESPGRARNADQKMRVADRPPFLRFLRLGTGSRFPGSLVTASAGN